MRSDFSRIDDPEGVLVRLSRLRDGDQLALAIPVVVSAQDPRDVASSLRDAVFICEELFPAFSDVSMTVEPDSEDPNDELIVLKGRVGDRGAVRSFIQGWRDVLDPDGTREPFILTSDDAAELYSRLDSDEPQSAFRFPELVASYREVRGNFDDWDD